MLRGRYLILIVAPIGVSNPSRHGGILSFVVEQL
jgi:hypothetical protein